MSDFGIKVATNGNDAKIAAGKQIVMSSKNPLAKIDRTNDKGVQNIRIQFNTNPPKGPVLVYSYAHGYKYTPTIWNLIQAVGVAAPYKADPYLMDTGSILFNSPASYADFFVEVDATNVYYYVNRYYDTLISNPSFNVTLAGIALRIRTYIFVEDVQM